MRLEPKNLLMGLWFSPLLSSILMLVFRPIFFDGEFEIHIEQIVLLYLYIGFFLTFIGGPFFLLLTRLGWLNPIGFFGAGICVGFIMVIIFKFGRYLSYYFPENVTDIYLSYIFITSIVVALLVWAISFLSYLIDRLRGIERILK